MKKYQFALLISTSVALLLLATFLFYYCQSVNIDFDEARYDKLLSRKEAAAKTNSEHSIVRIIKLAKESHRSSQELNTALLSSVYWLAWTLVGIAIIQLSVVASFYNSKPSKGTEPHN